jgi:hypothetical protein
MTPHKETPERKNSDQKTDASISRRGMAKKAAYVAPAVLAIISIAARLPLAASTLPQPQ